jgi:hypothetical protein
MEELVKRIEDDIKKAEARRDAFEKDTNGYVFNKAIVLALKTVLFDMRELKLIENK